MSARERCSESPCCSSKPIGGLPEFSALDALGLKLVCLDPAFAGPVRQIGEILGRRIGAEGHQKPLSWSDALAAVIPSCGLDGVIEAELVESEATRARLRIKGCSEALGWPVPVVSRPVCGFDAGLFEGFLRAATGDNIRVQETACLGSGDQACEFEIVRREGLYAEAR
jgi:predicted hydrocarbon binding protein